MKLLIVVDYQKDFVDGALGFEGAELLDNPEKLRELSANSASLYISDTNERIFEALKPLIESV